MKLKHLIAAVGVTLSFSSWAVNFTAGDKAPEVKVETYGEILVKQDDIAYQNWDSATMAGKTRVIQAIAGRSAAKALNQPMIKAIIAAQLPDEQYQTTTIINQSDSIWGTGSFVKSSAEDSKREFQRSSIVLDKDGAVAKAWQLQPKSSMIAVQSKDGHILWAKDGELTQPEIDKVISLIKSDLQ